MEIKFSDLDIDLPSKINDKLKDKLIRAKVKTDDGKFRPHPSGVYFYKNIPSYDGFAVLDYKEMEKRLYQKIDFLSNSYLDDIDKNEFVKYIEMIEDENIEWKKLWEYDEPYQLHNYPGILKEFRVSSVIDVAIVLSIIRPGAIHNYDKMKKYIHTDKLLKTIKSKKEYKILKDTYGIPVFEEQFKKLGIDNDKYRYKKAHAIGYSYVLLIDFLKNS
jgi:hypothetical protein